jgi:hypothetical protein
MAESAQEPGRPGEAGQSAVAAVGSPPPEEGSIASREQRLAGVGIAGAGQEEHKL